MNLVIIKYLVNYYQQIIFRSCKFKNNGTKKLSVDVTDEFIHFSYWINKNCQNEQCSVYNFLNDARKLVDDKQNNAEMFVAFKKICQDNIVIFFSSWNFFSKNKFQQI